MTLVTQHSYKLFFYFWFLLLVFIFVRESHKTNNFLNSEWMFFLDYLGFWHRGMRISIKLSTLCCGQRTLFPSLALHLLKEICVIMSTAARLKGFQLLSLMLHHWAAKAFKASQGLSSWLNHSLNVEMLGWEKNHLSSLLPLLGYCSLVPPSSPSFSLTTIF